ncbi:uncharacterized protein G2W53_020913 [Senna tora]|uniref:Uncharacterized protein n=1 Tax=Senna tora TaxID=362788 RepID=A0A834WMY2_9FABA|nr:uncharacterized protein G2W53_020913 [Senna tora]
MDLHIRMKQSTKTKEAKTELALQMVYNPRTAQSNSRNKTYGNTISTLTQLMDTEQNSQLVVLQSCSQSKPEGRRKMTAGQLWTGILEPLSPGCCKVLGILGSPPEDLAAAAAIRRDCC